MRRSLILAGFLMAGLSLSLAPRAHAGKPPAGAKEEKIPLITMTGVSAMDGVFGEGRDIQVKLDGENKHLKEGRGNLNTALGVATDAPVATALAGLKASANGKLKIVLAGRVPHLQPSDAVPENVQKGVDAVNHLTDDADKAATTAVGLKGDAVRVFEACKDFPGKLPSLVSNPMELPKATKITADNVKAISDFPKYIDRIAADVDGIFKDVGTVFAE